MSYIGVKINSLIEKVAGMPLMDVAFSNSSRNGVQNKVIKAKFDEVDAELNTKTEMTKGIFTVSVTANTVTTINSSSDIISGELPSNPRDCIFKTSGYSANAFFADIHVDSGAIKIYTDKTQNITVYWNQLT